MTRYRALAGVALAVSLAVSTTSARAAAPVVPKNHTGHAHHLLKAEEDLVAAEASIVAQNLGQAQKHVASAIKQIEEAIAHHHKHHIAQSNGTNFSGLVRNAKHHHHHATLKQALAELLIAEGELKAGGGAKASKEIEKAAKTIKNAVASHHHLFAKA